MRYKRFSWVGFVAAVLTVSTSGSGFALDDYISAPAVGSPYDEYHTATKGEITQFNTIDQEDFPAVFLVPLNCEVILTGTRASTDWDTHRTGDPCNMTLSPVEDSLRPNWPRWKCPIGVFVLGDGADKSIGAGVIWKAPNSPGLLPDGEALSLWDDDDREVEDPLDPRNDGSLQGYGNLQDSVRVRAVELDVTLFIRNADGQPTTCNTLNGPNSRGELGLWDAKVGSAADMTNFCSEHVYGDTVNGGASHLEVNSHPFAVGTALKTEIYARIVENDFIDYDFMMELLDNEDNWRIGQEFNGHWTVGGAEEAPWNMPPGWDLDAYSSSVNSVMNCHPQRNVEFFYFADAPGFQYEDAEDYDEDTVLSLDMNFRTWVEFCYLGSWVRVTDVPAPEGAWTYGKPMWGYTAQIKKMGGELVVTQQPTAKSY